MQKYNNKGITLVALVVTIIVMTIIAGVTVGVTLGDGGILDKSRNEATKFENEANEKKVNLAVLSAARTGNGTVTQVNLTTALNDQLGEGNYTLTVNSGTGDFELTVGVQEFVITTSGIVTETTN